MPQIITGVVGRINWAYFLAGDVRDWTLSMDGGVRSLTGTLQNPDTLRLSQQPLVFVAPHAKGAYRWPITSLQIAGASCTAMLGPMERSTYVLPGRQA